MTPLITPLTTGPLTPLGVAQALMPHLMVAPLLLPLLTAALMLLMNDRRPARKAVLGLTAAGANVAVAALLLRWTAGQPAARAHGVYLPSNWDVPYGIVLVVDHLSALMLLVAALVALLALLFAVGRWDRAGARFHVLFQIQVMGLNGTFLTGDLFNLFVFFEVMLAASYGLLLHGSGPARVKAGLHYLVINLVASSLFLVGASLVYGVTGTLNLADLATRIPQVAAADRPLLHAACGVLAVAFLAKAAMWPLNFWLVPAYAAASGPSAAVFALLTKVGAYVLLRLSTLLFSPEAGASAGFGNGWLLWGGAATLAFGALGMVAAQRPARVAAWAVIVSSGTVLAMQSLAQPGPTAGVLVYLPGSILAVSAFFLLAELMERARLPQTAAALAVEDEEDRLPVPLAAQELGRQPVPPAGDGDPELPGRAIPGATALLGLAFIACTLLVAGLPPLSGFVGKFAMLSALLGGPGSPVPATRWALMALVVTSGLLALVAMSRVGIRFFWAPVDRPSPVLRVIEFVPIAMLVGLCMVLTTQADAMTRYAQAAAASLYRPQGYIDAVMSARPRPGPATGAAR